MRHKRRRYKLGRKTAHRKATLESLVTSLFRYGRIQTTITKARAATRLADQMITLAKRADLHATRQIQARLQDKDLTHKLVKQIAPTFKERQGGYTRIMRYRQRAGDGAQMVVWQLSDYVEPVIEKDKKKKKEKLHAHDHAGHTHEEKPSKKKAEAAKEEVKKPGEEKKKGGFLSGLRKFLTGEQKPEGKPKE